MIDVILGPGLKGLASRLRAAGYRVRPSPHLLALFDEIAASVSARRPHAVVADVRQSEEAASALLRLRRVSNWGAPLVLLASRRTPLLEQALLLGDVQVVSEGADVARILRRCRRMRADRTPASPPS